LTKYCDWRYNLVDSEISVQNMLLNYKGTYRSQGVAIKELKDKERAGQAFLKEASVMT
jgi:hypothetical protein